MKRHLNLKTFMLKGKTVKNKIRNKFCYFFSNEHSAYAIFRLQFQYASIGLNLLIFNVM